jgi:hypothetical protein
MREARPGHSRQAFTAPGKSHGKITGSICFTLSGCRRGMLVKALKGGNTVL